MEDAMAGVKKAQKDLDKAHQDLEQAKRICESVEEINRDEKSSGTATPKDLSALLEVIEKLHSRVGQLEGQNILAEKESTEKNENLKRTLVQLGCGGFAGAVSRTVVAPIDRVKILMQTQFLMHEGKAKYTSIAQ